MSIKSRTIQDYYCDHCKELITADDWPVWEPNLHYGEGSFQSHDHKWNVDLSERKDWCGGICAGAWLLTAIDDCKVRAVVESPEVKRALHDSVEDLLDDDDGPELHKGG